mgnify:CR=1 FL=1
MHTERQLSEVRFLTVAEVASIMRVSKMTVYRLVHGGEPVSYTHLRAHETVLDLVCRLLLEKKKKLTQTTTSNTHQAT